jgi:hypothetical protein
MTFLRYLHSRGVARDGFHLALGYFLASMWADKLILAACFAFGMIAYLIRRRYGEWSRYHLDLGKLEGLESRAKTAPISPD